MDECKPLRGGGAGAVYGGGGQEGGGGAETHEVKLATLTPGSTFGEVALRFHCPRTATVRATTDCVMLQLGREVGPGGYRSPRCRIILNTY